MSFYENIPAFPPDPIFGLSAKFKTDPRKDKYTFITGYFRNEELKTPVLDCISQVERHLANEKIPKEYLPIDGDREFIEAVEKLAFGKVDDRITGIQTVGGTGALYLAGRLAKSWTDQIAISDPTWANHWKIFAGSGLKTLPYPYFRNRSLVFQEMLDALSGLKEKTCVLLHTSSHNPSGMDLSHQEWEQLYELLKEKKLFPILDMAYQGFASTPDEDAYAPRFFLEKGMEFALTYTCAKSFSMYGERAGALFVIGDGSNVLGQLKSLAREIYSNPPMHASSLVKGVLKDPKLEKLWHEELSQMRKRMEEVRKSFIDMMVAKDPNGNWGPLRKGKGLFCPSELSKSAIEKLQSEKGMYLAVDGRINLTGINEKNLEMFTDAIVSVS